MGRSISMGISMFAGIRVAGELVYIPQHTKNGKLINAKVTIPVYANSHRGHDQKTGEEGRKDSYKIIAWGKLATICCLSLSPGKAIDVICKPQSYEGHLFNRDGSLRVDAAGQPVTTNKVAFTIMDIVFGEESAKHIQNEIAQGLRPAGWNVQGHPDYQTWLGILTQRQALIWDGRSPRYGYARVSIPQGAGVQLDFTNPTSRRPDMVQNVHSTFSGQPAPGTPAPGFAGQPVQQPVAPAQGFAGAGYPQAPAAPQYTGFANPNQAPAVNAAGGPRPLF